MKKVSIIVLLLLACAAAIVTALYHNKPRQKCATLPTAKKQCAVTATCKKPTPKKTEVLVHPAPRKQAIQETSKVSEAPVEKPVVIKTARDSFLQEVGFMGGWGTSDEYLKNEQIDYEVGFCILRFGFDLKPFFEKHNIKKTPAITQFAIEPFINPVFAPGNKVEAGVNIMIRLAFALTKRVMPYIEAGGGGIYMTQDTENQSTDLNFNEQGGAGLLFFYKRKRVIKRWLSLPSHI